MAIVDFDKSYAQNKINNNKLQEYGRTQSAEAAKVSHAKAAVASRAGAVAAESGTDAVILTDTAKKLNEAQDKAKNSSGVDNNRIASIKKALADGSYGIDYNRLASNMVASESELSSIFG